MNNVYKETIDLLFVKIFLEWNILVITIGYFYFLFFIQSTLDNSNTRKLEQLGRSNFFQGPLSLQALLRQKKSRKLEHLDRSNFCLR